jgi:hypothetical protein
VPNAGQQAAISAAISKICELAASIDPTQELLPDDFEKAVKCKRLLQEACDKYSDENPDVFVGDLRRGAEADTARTMPDSRSGQGSEYSKDPANLVGLDQYDPGDPSDQTGLGPDGRFRTPPGSPGEAPGVVDQEWSNTILAGVLAHEYMHCVQIFWGNECFDALYHAMIYQFELCVLSRISQPGVPAGAGFADWRRGLYDFESYKRSLRERGFKFLNQASLLGCYFPFFVL